MSNAQVLALRPSQFAVETACQRLPDIQRMVRISSPVLTTACRQLGLPIDLAEACAGLLASVADDLVAASKLRRTDFERSKRIERVLAACEEPAASALRIAMVASPTNGRACARHWDAICESDERGMFAWKLGMDTDSAYRYGKRLEQRQ